MPSFAATLAYVLERRHDPRLRRIAPAEETVLEFDVVLVDSPAPELPPVLTPLQFTKEIGDRIFLGKELDPETLHIFLSGNPLMIGLPEWEGDTPEYPETEGVIEILTGRGFSVDRRGHAGNVHYEEYW